MLWAGAAVTSWITMAHLLDQGTTVETRPTLPQLAPAVRLKVPTGVVGPRCQWADSSVTPARGRTDQHLGSLVKGVVKDSLKEIKSCQSRAELLVHQQGRYRLRSHGIPPKQVTNLPSFRIATQR